MGYKILLLEDNKIDADLASRYLERSEYDFEINWVKDRKEYEKQLNSFKPDLVLSDYNLLGEFDGLDALKIKKKADEEMPFIFVSGTIGEEKAVELIRMGAVDFIVKENVMRLPQVALRAIEEAKVKKERLKAVRALEKERNFTVKALNSLPGLFCVLNSHLKIIRLNDQFAGQLGYALEESVNESVLKFVADSDRGRIQELIQQIYDTGEASEEIQLEHKDGSSAHYLLSGTRLIQEDKHFILATGINISDRVKAEQNIKQALKEREVLLKEIHHRVKNNLAVVSGMLELQAFQTEEQSLKAKLKDSQSRVISMGLIHELLYKSQSFSQVNFSDTISRLVDEITNLIETDIQIDIQLDLQEIELNVNQAIPCTLILNELITNVYKHAFPDKKKGTCKIFLSEAGNRIKLTVKDNGAGLPDKFTLKESKTLGLKLIEVLINQLNARLKYKSNSGSEFSLTFEKLDKKGSGSTLV